MKFEYHKDKVSSEVIYKVIEMIKEKEFMWGRKLEEQEITELYQKVLTRHERKEM